MKIRFFQQVTAAMLLSISLLIPTKHAFAQTEFHLQIGNIVNPNSNQKATTTILTFQQASSWSLGHSFYFINYSIDNKPDGINDRDFYGEWFPTLSIGKLKKEEIGYGPIVDFGIISGIAFGAHSKVFKFLPGLRVSWDIPGFLFLNTDFMAAIDRNAGIDDGGAPTVSHSIFIDVNWAMPFEIGNQSFSISGHANYTGSRTNELNEELDGSILAQPQFRWDLGWVLAQAPDQLMVGIEYQYWSNKLGSDVDESAIQLLAVWRL